MTFAQLTDREGLRDIEVSLGAIPENHYHLGFRNSVSRSTLADVNEKRGWRIFAEIVQVVIAEARRQYATEPLGVDRDLETTDYALDYTTIDLRLSFFPWAKFRTTKSALKVHTLPGHKASIPAFLWITEGKVADLKILDLLIPEPGSIYVANRGYIDFKRL
jgi:hypothetical protein